MTPSWLDLVGYHHEVAHTGVLRALLEDEWPAPTAAEVVTSLLVGREVSAIDLVEQERRLAGASGTPDLVARLDQDQWLVVETKVDSGWSWTQLEANRGDPPSGQGVLLALGLTALSIGDPAGSGFTPGSGWSMVGPEGWAEAVARNAPPGDPTVADYVAAVRSEAEAHSEARAAAREARPLDAARVGRHRSDPSHLAHWGYFAEVLSALGGDAREWEAKVMVSGPLLTRWVWFAHDLLHEDDWDAGVYLEFVGERGRQTRSLRIKAFAPAGDGSIAMLQQACAERLGEIVPLGRPRRVSPSHKTCTVGQVGLEETTPSDAAALAATLRSQGAPVDALREVYASRGRGALFEEKRD